MLRCCLFNKLFIKLDNVLVVDYKTIHFTLNTKYKFINIFLLTNLLQFR